MATTVVSAKGQVVLPKALRDAKGWTPGTRLAVEETPDGLTLRVQESEPIFPPTTIDEAFGCLKYDGPPKTIEEMDAGVAEGIREMWREFEAQSKDYEDRER